MRNQIAHALVIGAHQFNQVVEALGVALVIRFRQLFQEIPGFPAPSRLPQRPTKSNFERINFGSGRLIDQVLIFGRRLGSAVVVCQKLRPFPAVGEAGRSQTPLRRQLLQFGVSVRGLQRRGQKVINMAKTLRSLGIAADT